MSKVDNTAVLRQVTEACVRSVQAKLRELAAEGKGREDEALARNALFVVEGTVDFTQVLSSLFLYELSEDCRRALVPDPLGQEEGPSADGLYQAFAFLSDLVADMIAVMSGSAALESDKRAREVFGLVCDVIAHRAEAMRLKAMALKALAAAAK
ncbi:MAG: hypothetical protein KatS3mg054_0158 [Chloroflexus sp.]|nr:MAG: hypothetical protein KatS3mg054_0158 [Chloroflexus sp.]